MPRYTWIAVVLVACGGGMAPSDASHSLADSTTEGAPSDGSQCGNIAVQYGATLAMAIACDPAAPNACTEWRPIPVAAVPNGGNAADAKTTGLCFAGNWGYVTPQHTAALDTLIARYNAAGCTVSYCPSPAPREIVCQQNTAGHFTCGGH